MTDKIHFHLFVNFTFRAEYMASYAQNYSTTDFFI